MSRPTAVSLPPYRLVSRRRTTPDPRSHLYHRAFFCPFLLDPHAFNHHLGPAVGIIVVLPLSPLLRTLPPSIPSYYPFILLSPYIGIIIASFIISHRIVSPRKTCLNSPIVSGVLYHTIGSTSGTPLVLCLLPNRSSVIVTFLIVLLPTPSPPPPATFLPIWTFAAHRFVCTKYDIAYEYIH